jgi:tRNA (guanine37-N1)-methyltransferase
MVMKPEPLITTILDLKKRAEDSRVILLSPQGERFSQLKAQELAGSRVIGLVCGRYEGIDERVRSFVDSEISIGDFVLPGGESAALVVMETVIRLLPGSLGNLDSTVEESFSGGLLEYPQYTRPRRYMGMEVPPILLSGDHRAIRVWRRQQQLLRTQERRPDLLSRALLTPADRDFLDQVGGKRGWIR